MGVSAGSILALSDDLRAFERTVIERPGVVRLEDGAPIIATVIDLTRDGCRIAIETPLARNQEIRIGIPGVGSVDARVVWFGENGYGCVFDTPLPPGSVTAATQGNIVSIGWHEHSHAPLPASVKWSARARVGLIAGSTLAFWVAIATVIVAL